ncbi:hypothetical protein ACKFKF_01020 [Phormidesmis sp. 146-12]
MTYIHSDRIKFERDSHSVAVIVGFNQQSTKCDRYEQAGTYGQLGLLAEAEGNALEARACLQTAMEIFMEFGDEYSMAIAQQILDRLSD